MLYKPCACFGYVLFQNEYPKGSVYDVQTSAISETVLFLTKGHFVFKNKETGEVLSEHFPGEFAYDWVDNITEATAVEESVLFCLTPKVNRGYIPEVAPIVLQIGDTNTFEAGTRFFLCQGTAEVNSAEFTGPCQIGFKGTQALKAKTDVYGLIIK